jgi:hypothetical protein
VDHSCSRRQASWGWRLDVENPHQIGITHRHCPFGTWDGFPPDRHRAW